MAGIINDNRVDGNRDYQEQGIGTWRKLGLSLLLRVIMFFVDEGANP